MTQVKLTGLLILLVFLFSSSCSIEKRVHLPGYHVEWKTSKKALSKIAKTNNTAALKKQLKAIDWKREVDFANDDILVSNDENITALIGRSDVPNFLYKKSQRLIGECETIVFRSGEEIQAKVIEIGTSEVRYKMCDNQSGLTFVKSKYDIFMIKYPNGTKTVFDNNTKVNSASSSSIIGDYEYLNTVNSDDKSFGLAVALWFLLGLLGIHRFYLGHIGVGVLYLLTAGLCGIGWIIDGILFLTGGLKPKKGSYIDM